MRDLEASHVHRWLPRTTLLVSALGLTACGTTVPVQSQVQATGGLGGPTGSQDPALSPGTTTGSTPGAAGGAGTGSAGTSGSVATGTGAANPALPTAAATIAGERVTAPLSLGVVLTATSNADQFGVSLGNTYSERQVDDAVIKALNAQGGLAGRKIVPVYAQTDTGSSNWETDFSAACATFTQDHHVEAVLGYVFNYFSSFERCLAAKRIPHLSTGFNVPDRRELS